MLGVIIVFAKCSSFARGGPGEDILSPTHPSHPHWPPPAGREGVCPSLKGRSQPGLCYQPLCAPERTSSLSRSVFLLPHPPGQQWVGGGFQTCQRPVHRAATDSQCLPPFPLPFHRRDNRGPLSTLDLRSPSHPGSGTWTLGSATASDTLGGGLQSEHPQSSQASPLAGFTPGVKMQMVQGQGN